MHQGGGGGGHICFWNISCFLWVIPLLNLKIWSKLNILLKQFVRATPLKSLNRIRGWGMGACSLFLSFMSFTASTLNVLRYRINIVLTSFTSNFPFYIIHIVDIAILNEVESFFTSLTFKPPANEVGGGGGILVSPCPSVCLTWNGCMDFSENLYTHYSLSGIFILIGYFFFNLQVFSVFGLSRFLTRINILIKIMKNFGLCIENVLFLNWYFVFTIFIYNI